jgi:hypothetical protein
MFPQGKKASFILEFPLGDDAHSKAIRGASAEPEPTPPIRRELPQRDPPLPRGQQGHLLLRQQDSRGHRAQRADVSAQAQRQKRMKEAEPSEQEGRICIFYSRGGCFM